MKNILRIIFFICTLNCYSQKYILENEENIFSFKTQKGKIVTLSKDKMNNYIVYRFGSKTSIELEYPDKTKLSWKKFKYSFYHRGGGEGNSGIELDNIWFIKDGFEYLLYTSYRVGDKFSPKSFEVGIKVTNLKTNKIIKIIGTESSIKGTIKGFRTNNLVEIDEDRID